MIKYLLQAKSSPDQVFSPKTKGSQSKHRALRFDNKHHRANFACSVFKNEETGNIAYHSLMKIIAGE